MDHDRASDWPSNSFDPANSAWTDHASHPIVSGS